MAIHFFQEGVDFQWEHEVLIRQWIAEVISSEKQEVKPGDISIIFCSDEYLLDINKRFLDHDFYTDIVTFPYTDNPLSADLYISTDRVYDNATAMEIGFLEELHRVIIHGILHLCGYPDKSDQEKSKMRSLENYYLNILPRLEEVKYK